MNARRGFTLVEVLVALAIVSVGLAALFTTTTQSVRTSSYLREKTLGQWLALNKLTEARVNGTPPASDKSEGEVKYANAEWKWELEKVPTAVAGIVRLESRVALKDAPKDTWLAQSTGFMGAALAPPGSQPPPNWVGDPRAHGAQGQQGQPGQQGNGMPGEPVHNGGTPQPPADPHGTEPTPEPDPGLPQQ